MIGVKVCVWAPETVNLSNLWNIIAAYTGVSFAQIAQIL